MIWDLTERVCEGGSLNWNSEGMGGGGIHDWKSEGIGGFNR